MGAFLLRRFLRQRTPGNIQQYIEQQRTLGG
jgi:hypothetical protein